jgi:hypothetical protein
LDKKRKTIVKQFDVIQIDLDNDLEEDFELIYDKDIGEGKDEFKYNYRNINFDINHNFNKKENQLEIDLPKHYKKKTYDLIFEYIDNLAKY